MTVLIFGGTTEGRELAGYCRERAVKAVLSVTTDYGAELISKQADVIVGKMDSRQIINHIKTAAQSKYSMVIDATHPYARLATFNIKAACKACGVAYYRLLRGESPVISGAVFNSMNEVAEYLNQSAKKALITTGSKDLHILTAVKNFRERLTVRVLAGSSVSGFAHVIYGDGRYSVDDNIKHIRQSNAEVLVTKESGAVGGYCDKVKAAQICGTEAAVIKRPKENGYSMEEIKEIIIKGTL
jgi:precorrin-6Y C5,15-methyltransferase (decarboxylating)/precorrin-6A/cobalt-precorrin-6A reductase